MDRGRRAPASPGRRSAIGTIQSADRASPASGVRAMRESSAVTAPAILLSDAPSRMLADVRDGLLRDGQKELPPTYFYDARGSQLFDEITRLDEYYPTRAERGLLEHSASAIVQRTTPRALAELGAGTATKSRVLLREITRHGNAQYLPLDVDGDTLEPHRGDATLGVLVTDVVPIIADMRDDVAAHGARHPCSTRSSAAPSATLIPTQLAIYHASRDCVPRIAFYSASISSRTSTCFMPHTTMRAV